MPPKKNTPAAAETTNANGNSNETKFSWTPENDRLLLILTMGRTITTEYYAQLVEAMPGSNYNGVRIRVSKMRIEQRAKFAELGWEEREELKSTAKAGAKAGAKGTAKKRKPTADDVEDVEHGEMQRQAKKPKAKTKKAEGAAVTQGESGQDQV